LRDAKCIQVPLKRFISDQLAAQGRTAPRKHTAEQH